MYLNKRGRVTMRDFSSLIPKKLCPKPPVINRESFLYLGSETILFLAETWNNISAQNMGKAVSNERNSDEYLMSITEAQENRKKVNELKELATRATSKPQIFPPDIFLPGEHITCFIQDSNGPRASDPGHLVNSVIMKSEYDKKRDQIIYWLRTTRENVTDIKEYRFVPDRVSIFPSEDVAYYRLHKNFLQTALELRATNDAERDKIEKIIAAFSAKA